MFFISAIVKGSEKNLIAQLIISTVTKWDYGSGENQYRATRFSTIAKWERVSGRTAGNSLGVLYVSISVL